MSSDAVIEVADIGKRFNLYERPHHRLLQLVRGKSQPLYREFWALRNISFAVRAGETVGIVGRNGSGKSTLLQIVCGTMKPTIGAVSVKGRVAALLELGAGFAPEFTGRENALLSATLYGLTREQARNRLDDILAFADIGDFIDQPVKHYSSGMFVRLAFSVIAHVDADVLVIDEALSVGDAYFAQKCMRFLHRFRERGSLLFVSHDSTAVTGLCNHAIWLDAGTMRKRGSAKEVTEAYLESTYARMQGSTKLPSPAEGGSAPVPRFRDSVSPVDQRQALVNASNLRNDLEVFAFDSRSGFGIGGGRIVSVEFEDSQGRPLSWVVGGELVRLRVTGHANQPLHSPIVGFFVKDRLGQILFGDNSYLSYYDAPVEVAAGEQIEAEFEFRMPILPVGDYSVTVALAEGTQHQHVQHHWIHDALMFKSHSSSTSSGLVGIPMLGISLKAGADCERRTAPGGA
jgi:homopolymeric O-antigen transport system ATP-binding protein